MTPWNLNEYEFRKQFLKLAGGAFRIYDTAHHLLLFSEQKAFKLREDIRVYSDESKKDEVLVIKTQAILDISATYDVIESKTSQKIGALRRKGLKSILKDEWEILDPQSLVIGKLEEDSALMATLRRFLTNLIPQKYTFSLNGYQVGEFRQHFNPFVYNATMDLRADQSKRLDRRMALAAGILLLAVEGRQD